MLGVWGSSKSQENFFEGRTKYPHAKSYVSSMVDCVHNAFYFNNYQFIGAVQQPVRHTVMTSLS